MQKERALLELTLMDAEAAEASFDDIAVEALNRGIPPEVVTRLQQLWTATRVVAGHALAIGRVIVLRIMGFLRANPEIAVGAALGAAVAALLSSSVPFIGPLLAPIAVVLGALYGAGAAIARRDGTPVPSAPQALVAIAATFLQLFLEVLTAVSDYVSEQLA